MFISLNVVFSLASVYLFRTFKDFIKYGFWEMSTELAAWSLNTDFKV